MKYLVFIPFGIFLAVSYTIGALCFCWRFSKRDFKKGLTYINDKYDFVDYIDRHFFK